MTQLDMFAEPKAPPSASEPTVMRFEDHGSYAQMIIAPLDDGTWGIEIDDWYHGLRGRAGPVDGSHPTFIEALGEAMREIELRAVSVQIDRSSCCGDRHKAFATKVRAWLREIETEHFTDEWLAGEIAKQRAEREAQRRAA